MQVLLAQQQGLVLVPAVLAACCCCLAGVLGSVLLAACLCWRHQACAFLVMDLHARPFGLMRQLPCVSCLHQQEQPWQVQPQLLPLQGRVRLAAVTGLLLVLVLATCHHWPVHLVSVLQADCPRWQHPDRPLLLQPDGYPQAKHTAAVCQVPPCLSCLLQQQQSQQELAQQPQMLFLRACRCLAAASVVLLLAAAVGE